MNNVIKICYQASMRPLLPMYGIDLDANVL